MDIGHTHTHTHKGTEQENDLGEGEPVIEEGLIFWEDVAPLSIWVNSLRAGLL